MENHLLHHQSIALADFDIQNLRSRVGGYIFTAGDERYETTRRVFNAMIDRRPALIARPERRLTVVSCYC